MKNNESILDAVASSLTSVLKDQYAEKKRAERERRTPNFRIRNYENTIRDSVFAVIEEAAAQASSNFTLPYSVRQLYYQVRPLIQKYTDKELSYAYFTPPLVTEYESYRGSLRGLIYEPRGHFQEPHNETRLPLGTVEVANYAIPDWEYDKILYIEKEGFRQIFDAVKLGQRYDMALMTAQGFATRAAKQLLASAKTKEIAILIAHDCDLSGYEIARAIENTTRTSRGIYGIIDLGLTLEQTQSRELEAEDVYIQKRPSYSLLSKLSKEEKEFFLGEGSHWRRGYNGNRVELNAMTTEQLISWLEDELEAHGLNSKVLPPKKVATDTLKEVINLKLDEDISELVTKAIEKLLGLKIKNIEKETKRKLSVPLPKTTYNQLKKFLAECPPEHWKHWIAGKGVQFEERYIKKNRKQIIETLAQRLQEGEKK